MNIFPLITVLTLIFALLLVSEIFSMKRKVRKLEKRLNIMWNKIEPTSDKI